MGPNQNMHIVKAGRDCLAQQTDKWREFTKPGYDGVSTSLGVRLIHHARSRMYGPQDMCNPIVLVPKSRITVLRCWERLVPGNLSNIFNKYTIGNCLTYINLKK